MQGTLRAGTLLLTLLPACGPSSYLIEKQEYVRTLAPLVSCPNPAASAAAIADSAAAAQVWGAPPTRVTKVTLWTEDRSRQVQGRVHRLYMEGVKPVDENFLRVRPRRAKGLLATSIVFLSIGVPLMTAGLGLLACPPMSICEQGLAVAVLLGVGAPHVLVGGITGLTAAGRWGI